MSKRNGKVQEGSLKASKIVCRKCGEKIKIIPGKNDNCTRMVRCPVCREHNSFHVDERGKLHGPPSNCNGHNKKNRHKHKTETIVQTSQY